MTTTYYLFNSGTLRERVVKVEDGKAFQHIRGEWTPSAHYARRAREPGAEKHRVSKEQADERVAARYARFGWSGGDVEIF